MSLAEKCDAYLYERGKNGQRLFGFEDLQRAFYAGAEAALTETAWDIDKAVKMHAEIDAFNKRPK